MTLRLTCLVAASALLAPAVALADSRPTLLGDYTGPRSNSIEIELGWYTDSDDGETLHGLSPVLGVRISALEKLDLELDWPFGFASVSDTGGDGFSEFRSGNPFLAGYYVSRMKSGYVRAGFGIALPLAQADDAADLIPLSVPLGMRGLWDIWLYAPEYLSLVVPLQVESHSNGLLVGADGAMSALVPTGDGDDTEFVLQMAGLVGGKHDAVSAGARLQLVWMPTSDSDNAQVAFVPFIQGDFDGGFAYLRFLVNLDEPLGVFGSGGDVWALYVGGGARF